MPTPSVNPPAHPRRWLGILGVSIALSAPLVQMLLRPWLESTFAFPLDRFFSLWVFWVALALVLGIAHFGEGFSLAAFGLKRGEKSLRDRLIELIVAVLTALIVSIVLIPLSGYLRGLITNEPSPALNVTNILPMWVMAPAWFTAAFTEEMLFRSYPIERLTLLTGRRWLAALITLTAFTLLHLVGWDWIHVVTLVLPAGAALTLLYLWRRSLLFVVVVHGVINAPLLLLPLVAPYL